MSDAVAALEAAKLALRRLHNGHPSQIKLAEAALHHISASLDPQSALALADRLLHPQPPSAAPSPAETMHAFHLLEQRVLPCFTTLPQPFRLQVRRFALRLVSPNPRYSTLHTNKAIAFLTALAVREWPQRYPTFINDIIAMPAHIGCRILANLSDDIYAFHSSIHPKRLNELRHAMALTLSTTLPFIVSAVDNFHNTTNWPALYSAVQCVRSFLTWASLTVLFSMRVPHACFMLVSSPRDDVRNEVLNALLDFVGRSFPTSAVTEHDVNPATAFRQVFYHLLNVVVQMPPVLAPLSRSLVPPTDAFPPLKGAWFQSQPLNSVDEEAHEFTVKFFEVLSKLGATHFTRSFLGSSRGPVQLSATDRELGAAFIDLMTAALSSPSYVLRDTVFNFFSLMTATITRKQLHSDLVAFLVTRFLHACTAGVLKFSCHPDVTQYKEVDHGGDEVTFRVARRKINGQMYGALRHITQVLPEVSAVFILSRLMRLISLRPPSVGNPVPSGPRELGIVCPDSDGHSWNFGDFQGDRRTWRHCIDTTCPNVDYICQVAGDVVPPEVKTQLVEMQRQAFEVINSWTDVDLLVPKAHALRVLFLLYVTEPSKLDACIAALGSLIDNPDTPSMARSRSCVSLRAVYQRLSRAQDVHIGRFANLLCDYAVNTLLNPKFREQDKSQLVEASIACVMSISDVKEAEQNIERMLMPLVDTLSSPKALSIHQSPGAFLEFLMKGPADDVQPIICAFYVLSNSMHQISRPMAKRSRVKITPGILSHAIAPKAVEVASVVISTLHAFFNRAKFTRDNTDKLRSNVLLPTCRDLVHIVNLDNKEVIRRVTDEHDSYEDGEKGFREGPTVHEERSYDILCSYGIDPPDRQFAWIRETLQNLRICAYEIIRACVLSGVTKSPEHLKVILVAICTDFQYMEPLHLLMLVSRVLSPLLSFSVTTTDPTFLEQVARSDVPKLLQRVREHIEASIKRSQTFSETSSLDIARECGRAWLRRVIANLISGMYPVYNGEKDSESPQPEEFFPLPFQVPFLGEALIALWIAVCSSGQDANGRNSFQYAFNSVSHAAALSPRANFQFFAPLLDASFKSAVLNAGDTSAIAEFPVMAALTIIRKWPVESERQLLAILGQNRVLQGWVTECTRAIAESTRENKPKKHKQLFRDLVNRIADHEGTAVRKETKVNLLPERLEAINAKRVAKRRNGNMDELELGDGALDSLFGGGDPL